jgi:hypothetical protein
MGGKPRFGSYPVMKQSLWSRGGFHDFLGTPLDRQEIGGRRRVKSPSLRGALATKQSILPLRGEMDCFASLAMTALFFGNVTSSRP